MTRAEPLGAMEGEMEHIDSTSVGDPTRHHGFEHLERALAALPSAPQDLGCVVLIVRRAEGGRRETPDRTRLEANGGVPGDAWGRRNDPNPEGQITVMQRDVAELIANGQPLTLFGDNLFLDLDLSRDNLPTGTRLRIGTAVVEVTPKPHNGCHKFRARFGSDAQRFVSDADLRHRNLRGIYVRVIENGEAARGDRVEVLARPAPTT